MFLYESVTELSGRGKFPVYYIAFEVNGKVYVLC